MGTTLDMAISRARLGRPLPVAVEELQRREIANLKNTIAALRMALDAQERKIAQLRRALPGGSLIDVDCSPLWRILGATAASFKVSVSDLLGPRHTPDVIRARFVAIYLCKQLSNKSSIHIGRVFGGRDSGTIRGSVRRAAVLRGNDPALDEQITAIEKQLRGQTDEVAG